MRVRSPALAAFMVKEFRHILRDRQTLLILLLLPLVQVVLFGFALRTDVHDVRLAFVDPAPDYATPALRGRFAGNGEFDVVGTVAERRGDRAAVPARRGGRGAGLRARLRRAARRGRRRRGCCSSVDASDPNTGSRRCRRTPAP